MFIFKSAIRSSKFQKHKSLGLFHTHPLIKTASLMMYRTFCAISAITEQPSFNEGVNHIPEQAGSFKGLEEKKPLTSGLDKDQEICSELTWQTESFRMCLKTRYKVILDKSLFILIDKDSPQK